MKFSGCGVDCRRSVHVKSNVAYFSDLPGVAHAEKCSPEPMCIKIHKRIIYSGSPGPKAKEPVRIGGIYDVTA